MQTGRAAKRDARRVSACGVHCEFRRERGFARRGGVSGIIMGRLVKRAPGESMSVDPVIRKAPPAAPRRKHLVANLLNYANSNAATHVERLEAEFGLAVARARADPLVAQARHQRRLAAAGHALGEAQPLPGAELARVNEPPGRPGGADPVDRAPPGILRLEDAHRLGTEEFAERPVREVEGPPRPGVRRDEVRRAAPDGPPAASMRRLAAMQALAQRWASPLVAKKLLHDQIELLARNSTSSSLVFTWPTGRTWPTENWRHGRTGWIAKLSFGQTGPNNDRARIEAFVSQRLMAVAKDVPFVIHFVAIHEIPNVQRLMGRRLSSALLALGDIPPNPTGYLMLTERAHGTTLHAFLEWAVNPQAAREAGAGDPPTARDLQAVFLQLVYSVAAFERMGISHNDLHLGNVMVEQLAAEVQFELCDVETHAPRGATDFQLRVPPTRWMCKIFDWDLATVKGAKEGGANAPSLAAPGQQDARRHLLARRVPGRGGLRPVGARPLAGGVQHLPPAPRPRSAVPVGARGGGGGRCAGVVDGAGTGPPGHAGGGARLQGVPLRQAAARLLPSRPNPLGRRRAARPGAVLRGCAISRGGPRVHPAAAHVAQPRRAGEGGHAPPWRGWAGGRVNPAPRAPIAWRMG